MAYQWHAIFYFVLFLISTSLFSLFSLTILSPVLYKHLTLPPAMTADSITTETNSDTTNLKNPTVAVHEKEAKAMVGSPMAIIDGVAFSSGDNWTNFANTLTAKPECLFYPRTLNDLQVIIREATKNKKKVRCVGTGHSWSGTAVTQDYMVSVNGMNQISNPVQGEDGAWTVTVESGVEVSQLDKFLREHNPPLALASNVVPTNVSCLVSSFLYPGFP
jgi:hypothetical protein